MDLMLRRGSGVPLYRQVVDQVRDMIRRGALQPGERLPTVRELAAVHGVTRLTVQSAYAELQAEDLIESHVGRGTFVSAHARVVAPHPIPYRPVSLASWSRLGQLLQQQDGREIVSFAEAMPEPETYPLDEISDAARRAFRYRDVLDYGPIQGDPDLRDAFSQLLLDRGLDIAPETLFVTAGAQQGIDLVLRGLTDSRDVILVEEPTYPGVLEAAAQQGRRVVGVPRDASGFDMEALEASCRSYQPALLYVIPAFGNPTGTSLPPDQRDALLELARTYDFLILEDDVYGFLALDDPAVPPLKSKDTDGRVIYLTSLSKALAPSLRLGVIAASASQLPAVAEAKQGSDLVCSMLLQRTAAEYLRAGRMNQHLDRARPIYRERRDAMLQALERHLPGCKWTRPAGGLSLWLTLPDGVDERDFIRDAADAGVGVAPGQAFVTQGYERPSMRLSFGMQPPNRIEDGVAALGRVLQHHLGRGDLLIAGQSIGPLV